MYSKGAEAASALPMEKASGQQMIAMLADPKRGVKKDELVNAGLLTNDGKVHPDWAGRTVTKSDLADHLNASLPKVAETSYGVTHGYPHRYAVDWYNAIEKAKKSKNKAEVDRLNKAWQESLHLEAQPPRFQKYSLPGGENYRERLWHLDDDGDTYQSSHWGADRGYKPVPDVLAHARMKDRIGPNGEKVLHVEEIQSDWGQKGRDEGWRDKNEEKFSNMIAQRDTLPEGLERIALQREINEMGSQFPAILLAPTSPRRRAGPIWR
jgi:hypothetical protein